MILTTALSALPRVGTATANRLARLGLFTVRDLLHYYPFRYEDFRQLTPIAELTEGRQVTVRARIELIANRRTFRKRTMITEALVSDGKNSLRVIWFNQPFLVQTLHPGDEVFLSGVVKNDMLGPELVSPSYEKSGANETIHTARLVPIYPTTEGVTQKQLRSTVKNVLSAADQLAEWVPESMLEAYDLAPLADAIQGIHFPKDTVDLEKSTERLKFDELLAVQLKAELSRRERLLSPAPAVAFHEQQVKQFVANLPFELTKAQKIAAWEILQDLTKSTPMNRLLSGDVGSGKTVVAAMALYNTALAGFQGALMAPTEILAEQHFVSLKKLLEGLPIAIALLTGHTANKLETRNPKPETNSKLSISKIKNGIVEDLKKGKIDIVVGTQALLTEGVSFQKLGLVIVDEQHRFGVLQRKLIKEKGGAVHFLSMTATPIPRSLALMLYGDLDVSVINELPPGRKKIITRLAEPKNREKAYQFIREQIGRGRQAFVICPLISVETKKNDNPGNEYGDDFPISNFQFPISNDDRKTVMSEYERLSKEIFPDIKVGYLHGKMKSKEKEQVMDDFKNHKLGILVSTSVIEVGVDVPNASVMMIEGAEKFGLAQLHQFRGRVGRSEHQSYCILFTDSDSSKSLERLKYFEAHTDGFKLAEKDLEMRGPGEVYGVEQSGMQELRLAKLTDTPLLKKAKDAAKSIASDIKKYPAIVSRMEEFEKKVHLE